MKSFFDRKLIDWHITIILYVSFMIFILIIKIIHVLLAFIEHNQEYRDVEYQDVASFLNIILGILGIHILSKTIVEFVVNIKENILLNLLKDLALPSILSIMFIPYIYLFVLYVAYKQVFMRLEFKKTIDDRYRHLLKIKIILFCNFDIEKVNNFIRVSEVMSSHVGSKEAVDQLINNCKE